MNNDIDEILLLDEYTSPIIIEDECAKLKPVIKDFVECYVQSRDVPVSEWLGKKMQENLPEKSADEIKLIAHHLRMQEQAGGQQ